MLDFKKVTIQNDESTVRVVLEKKVDMQAEHVKQGMYIEELEEKISMLKEQAEEHFQMFQLETRHAQKLMRQMANLKKAPTGQVIHFAPGCPHYAKASAIELCKKCMVEGGRDRISRAVKHMRIQPRISAICRYRLETPFWRKDRAAGRSAPRSDCPTTPLRAPRRHPRAGARIRSGQAFGLWS